MTDDSDVAEDGTRKRVLSNGQVLTFIAAQWMRRPRMLAFSIVLILLGVAFDLCMPWASGRLVDAVADPARRAAHAWAAWATFIGVYFAYATSRNAFGYVYLRFAARNMEEMTGEAFARVQKFSADWYADNFAGSTVRKVTRAMWGYDAVSDVVVMMLGPALLVLAGLSVVMLIRWPVVGLFTSVMVVLYVATNVLMMSRYMRPANLRSNALDSRIGGSLADAVTSNATIKGFGAESREEQRFAGVMNQWRRAVEVTWGRGQHTWTLLTGLLVIFQAGLTGLLVNLWAEGKASPGDVAFAITAFMLMSGYLRNIGDNVRMLQKGLDDTEDVAAYHRQTPEVMDRPDAAPFRSDLGEIVFDDVTFAYKNQPQALYQDFDLTIAPGERVALVGPTGSGKSTFVKLVQRLYDIRSGMIRIDGQDISHVDQGSLRRAIAVVPQDPSLFHRSIGENIAYGRPDATQEEIEAAAHRARAHDFIMRLPKGYDTLVGERGVKLSGGERQRVAIARAFLSDSAILVLDEATSSLDVETEREVQIATEALMAGRTTIVIAHRLSTIRGADRILVFQNGRVVEEGRHGELVAKGGAYARLHAVTEGTA